MLRSCSCVQEAGPMVSTSGSACPGSLHGCHTTQMFLSFAVGSGARLLHILFSLHGVLKLKWLDMRANS